MSKPKYFSFTKEDMIKIINTSSSMEEVLIKMNYSKSNDSRLIQTIRNYCDTLGIFHNHLPNILNTDIIICNKCNQPKLKENYYFSNGKLAQKVCKDCVRKKEKEKYQQVHNKIIEFKEKYPCKKCGCNKHYLIDFHHINPEEKDFSISENTHAKFETLLKEIEKCIPLCSNCHREFHYLEKNKNISLNEYLDGGME